MTDVEKYLKKLGEYILESLNKFNIYPENVTTEDRYAERYWVLNIIFDSECLGEPLKNEDGKIFNTFLRETVLEFLDSNTPDMLPKGIGKCEIFMISAQPWDNGATDIKWKNANAISFSIYLKAFKKYKYKGK